MLFSPCKFVAEAHGDIVVGKVLCHKVSRWRADGPDGTRVTHNLHLNHRASSFIALKECFHLQQKKACNQQSVLEP